MNINTNTLLNILAPKLNDTIKEKVDKLSVDSKINLDLVAKDKNIQTLITSLFKDISTGVQTKDSVSNLLQNSQSSLSFKNLSDDIKTLLKFIQNNPEINSKLTTQVNVLKESLLDLSKIDNNNLKNNISNSGIFLESKLLQQSIPISKNISQVIFLLTDQLNNKSLKNIDQNISMIQKQTEQLISNSSIPKDIKVEIKNAVANLLSDIKNLLSNQQASQNISTTPKDMQALQSNTLKQPLSLENIQSAIKNIEQKLQTNNIKSEIVNNLKELLLNTKEISLPNKIELINTIDKQAQQIISKPNIPQDIKLEIKNAIENLLRQVRVNIPTQNLTQNLQTQQTIPNTQVNQNTQMQQSLANTQNLTQNLQTQQSSQGAQPAQAQNIQTQQIQQNLSTKLEYLNSSIKNLEQKLDSSNIKNEIVNNFRQLVVSVKDQLSNNLNNLKPLLSLIGQKIDNTNLDSSLKSGFKNDLQNISTQLKSLEQIKSPQQQLPVLQNMLSNLKVIDTNIESAFLRMPQDMNQTMPKNLTADLKSIILQVQEQIEASKEAPSKELKATIDKVSSQIEFFQLASYASNSNHTYLSFLQDEIEDADVKFNKTKEDGFSCQINLTLKKYGDLKVLLLLDAKSNLNMNIGIENSDFKQKVQNNLQKLRLGINGIGLLLQNLNIFDINENKQQTQNNPYSSGAGLDFGLDIKA